MSLGNNNVRILNDTKKKQRALTGAMPAISTLTTSGQFEKTAIFKGALHFTSTVQITKEHCKLVPRFAVRYNGKDSHLVILQLERLDEVARIHRRKHREDNRFF
jgi:hypothetical protein